MLDIETQFRQLSAILFLFPPVRALHLYYPPRCVPLFTVLTFRRHHTFGHRLATGPAMPG